MIADLWGGREISSVSVVHGIQLLHQSGHGKLVVLGQTLVLGHVDAVCVPAAGPLLLAACLGWAGFPEKSRLTRRSTLSWV